MERILNYNRKQEKIIFSILIFLSLVLITLVYLIIPFIQTQLTGQVINEQGPYEVQKDLLQNKGTLYIESKLKCVQGCDLGLKITYQEFAKGTEEKTTPDQIIFELENSENYDLNCNIYENNQVSQILIRANNKNSLNLVSDNLQEIKLICIQDKVKGNTKTQIFEIN